MLSTRSLTWTKFRFTGLPSGSSISGTALRLQVFVSIFADDEISPARASEDVLAEGERVFEIVLLHDPRRP